MRLLHIIAPGEIGGLERVVQLLAHGQARDGADVHVAVVLEPGSSDHALVASLAAGGITPHPIAVPGRAYLRERTAILDLARRIHPDVVHTHGYRPDVVDATPARRMGIPTVTTVHGFTGGNWRNRLYERLQRRAYRSFDAVIVVSRPLKEQLMRNRVPADRIHVVQNTWQETAPLLDRSTARRGLGVSAEGFRIGWVGRLSAEKGPDVLLDALVHLTHLPLSVSIVGNGQEQQSLLARAKRLGVAQQIRWHGMVPDAARHFAAFDVFVLSSRTEATPIVLFEAMAAGVPIVAAHVGGVPDVVSSAEAALVPPADPVAIALGLCLYTYVGYPLILKMLSGARRVRAAAPASAAWPHISIAIPVYNEAAVIADTLERILALDYPSDRRQVLVVSDGSTDGTDEIVLQFAPRGVELLRLPQRRGKTAAENAARSCLTGEIIINTDASVRIDGAAVKHLVAAFHDPTVGVASGRDMSVSNVDDRLNPGEHAYVGYDMWVRDLETSLSGIVGASGCLYAIRRDLHMQRMPERLCRDFGAALVAREHGYRAVSVPEAVCYVPRSTSLRREYRRKVRTMARGLRTLWHKRILLNPSRHLLFAWMLWSHKL